MTVSVASAADFQPFAQAYCAIADPSSWATLPNEKARLPFGPNRFGPIWSVPMHGAIAPFESNAQPITIGLAAADAVAATTTASTAIAASGRNNAASFLLVITPSWVCVTVWVPVSYGRRSGSPGRLLCLDEPVQR